MRSAEGKRLAAVRQSLQERVDALVAIVAERDEVIFVGVNWIGMAEIYAQTISACNAALEAAKASIAERDAERMLLLAAHEEQTRALNAEFELESQESMKMKQDLEAAKFALQSEQVMFGNVTLGLYM